MISAIVTAVALLSSTSAGAQPVYKCEERGVITYTDRPCSPEAQSARLPDLIVTQPPGATQRGLAHAWDERLAQERSERDRTDGEWLKQHAASRDREARVRKAILEHRVIKSMTRDEVKRALGEPDHVDTGDSYGSAKETWTYASNGARRTVNFKNGEVTSTARSKKRSR